mmetsp:Transcript_131/g.1000  ORF Transcript_131/g.1000 Transcript_131/m.1000 type:complete len:114 (+) Transcript_131:2507-2848(+)
MSRMEQQLFSDEGQHRSTSSCCHYQRRSSFQGTNTEKTFIAGWKSSTPAETRYACCSPFSIGVHNSQVQEAKHKCKRPIQMHGRLPLKEIPSRSFRAHSKAPPGKLSWEVGVQ